MSESRPKVLSRLADRICEIACPHTVRVAIDGVDASGKTYMANELAPLINANDRPVIRASIDKFHNPRGVRYQRGVDSAEGYYSDSFNYDILQRDLLIPLGPDGDRKYRKAAFNLREDKPIFEAWREAQANAILLFDGVFLLRPILIQYWDLSIFLEVDFDVSVARAVARDSRPGYGGGTPEAIQAKYARRYVPGQQLYLAEANPKGQASIIVDNNDFLKPFILMK